MLVWVAELLPVLEPVFVVFGAVLAWELAVLDGCWFVSLGSSSS